MTTYKLLTDPLTNTIQSVLRDNRTHVPFDNNNTSYQAYLEWLAEGNTPLPAN